VSAKGDVRGITLEELRKRLQEVERLIGKDRRILEKWRRANPLGVFYPRSVIREKDSPKK
jgi:hypothetical protein